MARTDANPLNRREAVFFLAAWIESGDAVPAAREGLAGETDGEVRAAWLNFAASHGTGGSTALLEEALASPGESLEVRKMAAEMLAGGKPETAEALFRNLLLPEEVRKHIHDLYLVKGEDKQALVPVCPGTR